MARVICTKDIDAKTLALLEKSVERVIKKNKKVFDKLAKH